MGRKRGGGGGGKMGGEGANVGGKERQRLGGKGGTDRVGLDIGAHHAGAQVAGLVRGNEVGGEGHG